jgi:ribonuclease BN (tRNA processing enzyme)
VRLTVVGCSGSFPGPDSPASCYLVEAEGFSLVLDLGNGSLGALQRYVGLGGVDAVALSHLHADHCLDLCSYYVARKYDPQVAYPPLPVFGPSGTAERLARAYGLDDPGPGMDAYFAFVTWGAGRTYAMGPFDVTVERVEHPVEAYGFRVEHRGRVLTYSGDTAPCDALVRLARDADLFLCEAAFHEGRDTTPGIHLTGTDAGAAAAAAGARRLVLTHLPPWNDPGRSLAEARTQYAGPIEVASGGATYDL